MQMRMLGATGIQVSRYALGTMHLGAWGNADHDDAIRVVHAALEAGINLVDTADMYSAGESEEIVGRALEGRRDEVVLATKAHFPMGEGPNRGGNSRRWLTRAVEDSLRRLRTDRIDLFQIHRPDPTTDIDETLSVLSDLVRAGKIMAIGSSDFPAEQLVEARWVAEQRRHVAFRSEQPPYSIFVRGIERDVLPTAARYGLGVLTWSPLNSGWLTSRYRHPSDVEIEGFKALIAHKFDLDQLGNQRKLAAVDALLALADEAGLSLTHLALAFAAAHPAVSSVILGPRTAPPVSGHRGPAPDRLPVRRGSPGRRRCSDTHTPAGTTGSASRAPSIELDRRTGFLDCFTQRVGTNPTGALAGTLRAPVALRTLYRTGSRADVETAFPHAGPLLTRRANLELVADH